MALTNFATFSLYAHVVVDSVVTGKAMAGGVVGASEAASVKGTTVDTVGMTSLEVVANLPRFN